MNDETSATKPKLDLSSYTDEELAGLIPAIEEELERRKESKKHEALERMRALAAEVGMTPEELLGLPGTRRRRKRGTRKARAKK